MSDYNAAANNNFMLVFTDRGDPEITPAGTPVMFYARGVTLPGFSMPGAPAPYRGGEMLLPGNTRDRDDLAVEFLVAQNLENYKFFRKWARKGKFGPGGIAECFKDITLVFLDSNKQPIDEARYLSSFPTNISQLSLEHGVMDSTPMSFTVNLAFAEEVWE